MTPPTTRNTLLAARPELARLGAAALLAILAAGAVLPPPAGAEPRRRRDAPAGTELKDPAKEAFKFFQFGNQFFRQGMLRRAEEQFLRALSVQPEYPEASYMLALLYLELKEPHRAMQQANEALRQNPFFTECHNALGMAHALLGQHDQALQEFQAVLADINFPTPEVAHFNIGKIFWEKQACSDAVIHFRRALEVNPRFGRAWYLMGDCQEQTGQIDLARESYEKALELEGEDVKIMYRLGIVSFQQGDHANARRWFEKVRTHAPGGELAVAAREYVRQMDFR